MTYKYLEVFLFNDQPTTCPICGNRTEIIFECYRRGVFSEIHVCLTKECQFQLIMEADSDGIKTNKNR